MAALLSLLPRITLLSLLLAVIGATRVDATEPYEGISYWPSPTVLRDSALTLHLGPYRGGTLRSEARVALDKVSQTSGDNRSYWGVSVALGSEDTLRIAVRFVDAPVGEAFSKKWARINVTRRDSLIHSGVYDGFASMKRRYNSLGMRLNSEGHLAVSGGDRSSRRLFALELGEVSDLPAVSVWSVGDADVSLFAAGCDPTGVIPSSPVPYTLESLKERFAAGGDPVEGFWRYFDRQNNPKYARPGGHYTLALVRAPEREEYDILLVDGAVTLADQWKPMMLKGTLRPTLFTGHYDLTWIDATFRPMDTDLQATIEEGALLTLSFPIYKTIMRFAKIEKF